jgi:geranylgeranyl diphosphate synthase, type I
VTLSTDGPMDENLFQQKTLEYAELVDEELLRNFQHGEKIPNLHDASLYSMGLDSPDRSVRGKRIRPVLCLMTAEALGAPPRSALTFACAIELLHNFALVHDDIEDGDTMRRGRPATWQKYGLAHGVNIGDYMLFRTFRLLFRDPNNPLSVREQLTELFHLTQEHLFMGQSLDISARSQRDFKLPDYELIVVMKTGSYLAAPMLGGAIVARASEEIIEAITRFGRALGPLFQIKDDLIDLTSGKGRDSIGNDIKEGKRSYLVAAVTEQCSQDEATRLYDILDKPRAETTQDNVDWVIDLFKNHGAIDKAESYCQILHDRALGAITSVPKELKEVLETATKVLATRST